MNSMKVARLAIKPRFSASSISINTRILNSRAISTAVRAVQESDAPLTTPYQLFTKRDIPYLFSRYAPHMDPVPYYAAANVFPMRVTNYVLDNLINW
jgi:hypothetical protein